MNSESKLSQSLPDRVILGAIDDDTDDLLNDGGGYLRRNYDKIHGYGYENRSSYKRAIENFDITPPASPLIQNGNLRQHKKSDNYNINHLDVPGPNSDFNKSNEWDYQNSERDFNEATFPLHLQRRSSSQKNRRNPNFRGNHVLRPKRIIAKTGFSNIFTINIPERSLRFFKDFITTLIEGRWRYVLLLFSSSYCLSWFLFAILWYLVAYAHGDFLFHPETGERLGDGNISCVKGCHGFSGYLLLSIETQVTIGFGTRYPNEECPEGIFLLIAQLIIGMLLQGAMVGVVYAKIARPSKRNFERKFAKKAVICQRDGKLCLVFRIADPIHSHIIGTNVKAYWIEEKRSYEGEILRQYHYTLELEHKGCVLILWPQTIAHIIDENSPLYDFSARDLLQKKFEIIVSITGSSRTKGQIEQSITSYIPKEVLWGHRFKNILKYDYEQAAYFVEYSKFDEIIEITTPLCSAKRLEEVKKEITNSLTNRTEKYISPYFTNELDKNAYKEPIIIDFYNEKATIVTSKDLPITEKQENKTVIYPHPFEYNPFNFI